ncbi:tandem-95 repeat protein [Sulfurimonas sp. HSL1-2]|uniref:tandem-95 repeat protein n=1 Tax=Thiomicrolovo zhangzhouensis TaxID=3131933 RepID=UPI0031F8EE87
MVEFRKIMLSAAAVLTIGGCGGGGGGGSSSDPASSGGVIDGYVSGATVFADSTGEGEHNDTELSTVTDTNGDFAFAGTIADGTKIYAYGGTDISTGFPFEGRLSTVYDATRPIVLSPLTTYVAAIMASDPTMTFDTAADAVAANLGISADAVKIDPMLDSDSFMAAQKVQKVAEVLTAATKSDGETFDEAYAQVFESLASTTFSGDFNATELAAKVSTDKGVTLDPSITTFVETLAGTIDALAANVTTVSELDGFGETINTYAEAAEGAIENGDLTAVSDLTTTLDDMNTTQVAQEIETGTYVDPMIAALAEVEDALTNNITYLGTNTANASITADLVLSDPAAAPFDTPDLNLTWSATPAGVIDVATGAVTRSDTADVAVALKATVANSLVMNNRVFDLVVKRNEYAPVAVGDSLTLDEDTNATLNVLANDTDQNGDTLFVAAVSSAGHGTATLNPNGTVTYTPAANYNGPDSFTYTVGDGTGRSAEGNVSVTVTPVNDAPTIGGTPTTSVDQDAPYSFTPSSGDVDGDTLTFSIANPPAWAAFDPATGALTGTPGNGDVGTTADINISVTDGIATVSLPLFSVTVVNVNDAPTISGTPATSVNQDAPYSFTPGAGDIDGDTLTFSIQNKPSWATFDTATGALSGTPGNADVGTTTGIVISVSDSLLTASLAAFDLEVINVNDAPTASAASFQVPTNTLLDGDLSPYASDIDVGDTLTFTQVGTLAGLTLNSDGTFTFTSASEGNFTFDYEVSDGTLTSAPATVTISVVANLSPVAGDFAVSTDEDTAVLIDVVAHTSDSDGSVDAMTVAAFGATDGNLSVNPTTGVVTYMPNANFNGTDSFTYTIQDNQGATSLPATVTVTVAPVNDAPTIDPIGNPPAVAVSAPIYEVPVSIADVDGDALTLDAVSSNTGVASVSANGTTVAVDPTGIGTATVTVTVSDGILTAQETFTVNVVADPVLTDYSFYDGQYLYDYWLEDNGTANVPMYTQHLLNNGAIDRLTYIHTVDNNWSEVPIDPNMVTWDEINAVWVPDSDLQIDYTISADALTLSFQHEAIRIGTVTDLSGQTLDIPTGSGTTMPVTFSSGAKQHELLYKAVTEIFYTHWSNGLGYTTLEDHMNADGTFYWTTGSWPWQSAIVTQKNAGGSAAVDSNGSDITTLTLGMTGNLVIDGNNSEVVGTWWVDTLPNDTNLIVRTDLNTSLVDYALYNEGEPSFTLIHNGQVYWGAYNPPMTDFIVGGDGAGYNQTAMNDILSAFANYTPPAPPMTVDDYWAISNTYINSKAEWDGLTKAQVSDLFGLELWGVWPQTDGNGVVYAVDSDAVYVDANGTVLFKDINGTVMDSNAYTVISGGTELNISIPPSGHLYAHLGDVYDQAALEAMFGITMPAGSMGYRPAHLRLSDEFDFYHTLTSYDINYSSMTFTNLADFVAANQGGLSGYVFDVNGNTGIQFGAGDSYTDINSNGTAMLIDFSNPQVPSVVESGTWYVQDDGINGHIIVVDLPSRSMPYAATVKNDGISDYVTGGDKNPAFTGDIEMKFNAIARDALIAYFMSGGGSSTPTTANDATLVGAWALGGTTTMDALLIIADNDKYMAVQQVLGTNGVIGGVEVGQYTLDASGNFTSASPLINTNAGDTAVGATVSDNGNDTATLTSIDGSAVFNRLSSAISTEAGAWIVNQSTTGNIKFVIMVLDGAGNYMVADIDDSYGSEVVGTEPGTVGRYNMTEFGTYVVEANNTVTMTPAATTDEGAVCTDTDTSGCDTIAGDTNMEFGLTVDDTLGSQVPVNLTVSFDATNNYMTVGGDMVFVRVVPGGPVIFP